MVPLPAHQNPKPPAPPRYKPARYVESSIVPGFRDQAPTALRLVVLHHSVRAASGAVYLHRKGVLEAISYLRSDLTPEHHRPAWLAQVRRYRRLHTEVIGRARPRRAEPTIQQKEAA